MHDASWTAMLTPQHTDLTSCLFSAMKRKLYIACVYAASFFKKGDDSNPKKCLVLFSHLFQHVIQKC